MSDGRHTAALQRRQSVGALGPHSARRQSNDLKRGAMEAVSNALKSGALVQQPCEMCGAEAEAHHEDYSQPLTVRWLCPLHHRNVRKPYDRSRRRRLDAIMPVILEMTQAVRDEADRRGLTQREIAALCGVSQPVVRRWFGAGFRTLSGLLFVADALGLEFRYTLARRRDSERVA